ncbi:MAG: DUF4189 domain-containing protein [Pseudomonadota bacterium]
MFIAPAPSALAAGAVAVGQTGNVTKDGLAIGWATGSANKERAESVAKQKCLDFKDAPKATRKRCRIVNTFENQCLAIALDPKAGTPGYGYAVRPTLGDAKTEAMSRCRETAGNRAQHCVDTDSSCDGNAK